MFSRFSNSNNGTSFRRLRWQLQMLNEEGLQRISATLHRSGSLACSRRPCERGTDAPVADNMVAEGLGYSKGRGWRRLPGRLGAKKNELSGVVGRPLIAMKLR